MKKSVPLPWWKFVRALAPAVLFWAALVGWLAYLLNERKDIGVETDEASVREWIDEARTFRKTLPELIREYVERLDDHGGDPSAPEVQNKAEEIGVQLQAMVDPVRMYPGQLPSFPEFYLIEVRFLNRPDSVAPIAWHSSVPQPRQRKRS